jgi:hypothetical protein
MQFPSIKSVHPWACIHNAFSILEQNKRQRCACRTFSGMAIGCWKGDTLGGNCCHSADSLTMTVGFGCRSGRNSNSNWRKTSDVFSQIAVYGNYLQSFVVGTHVQGECVGAEVII